MKTVAEIQALLKRNGLYNGSIDSLVGNQTIKATQSLILRIMMTD